ncbi:hypothetical protein [Paenibacillus dauci]|nr:hypothetical protein [Paenibacillus dauci]
MWHHHQDGATMILVEKIFIKKLGIWMVCQRQIKNRRED